ncbi:MAG: ATP-binding cassette domain-containing protein [Bacteroidota bacterium]
MHSVVTTENLRKRLPTSKGFYEAVRGIDIEVFAQEIFGFLGPNGAGKTTTLRMLTTLLPIDEGEAWVAGFNVKIRPRGFVQR